ncbi:MAG: glycosyltransferase [Thermoproteota archaeon]
MPFKIGIGGFLRSYYVLPRLAKLLTENGYEVEVYIPANAVRAFISFLLSTKSEEHETQGRLSLLDELFELAIRDVNNLERQSKYAFAVNEKLLEKNVEYNRQIIGRELKQRSYLRRMFLPKELRPFLIHLYEKKFASMVKRFVKEPIYGYSMHETADAVTALTILSSRETKTVVLLQSDLGKNLVEKTVNLNLFKNLGKRTMLCGLLSVSPAPIVETPELLALCRTFRVLVPGVAVDFELLKKGSKPKKANTAAYYGRISKEKGIFDLLKAWSIIEKKEDAYLYIAGGFDDYKIRVKFDETIKKYCLKTVKYLGYLERDKLFDSVSSFSILAYPSYRDSFSLTVLESLFMKLRVVAYDIPALRYIYRGNTNVKLVPIGDFKRLALVLMEDFKKPFEMDGPTIKLLGMYSSWEKVVTQEYKTLNKMLCLT